MKKVLTVLVAMTMVIGFAGMGTAQMCMDCDDPGYINRGCDTPVQGGTVDRIFDYNDTDPGSSYCGDKGDVHRAILDVCECDAEWVGYTVDQIGEGLTVDISLEILVNGESGNHGVYWAQDLDSVKMWTDNCNTGAMCSKSYGEHTDYVGNDSYPEKTDFDLRPLHMDANKDLQPYSWTISSDSSAIDFNESPKGFRGPFIYEDIDGNEKDKPGVNIKTTIMKPDPSAEGTGYLMTSDDISGGKCTWGFDMPAMWVNDEEIIGGEVVTVKVTLTATDSQGLCHKDACTCEINIGTLCCPVETPAGMGKTLTFPYMPRLNGYYEAQGIALTNLDSDEGTATVTLYENDGDVFQKQVTVSGNSSFNITPAVMETMELQAGSTGNGALGTVSGGYYVVIETGFNASGLAYFANPNNGESLGYLPVSQ